MSWFKVDDRFWSHPKTAALSDGAVALWIRAGSWSAGHLTDGFVPDSTLRFFRARRRSADELVAAGLWLIADGGFVFHDWAAYQPSKAQVTARREATKTRVDQWRAGKSNGVTDSSTVAGSNASPDPTRTRPVSKDTPSAAKRGSRLPDGWMPSPELIGAAKVYAPSVNLQTETENFRDWWAAKAGAGAVKVDWDATWRGWMRRAHERNVERGWKPGASEPWQGMRVLGGPEQ